MKPVPSRWLSGIALFLTANLADSQTTIYEAFVYGPGVAVSGQGGSTDGWGGAWSTSGGSNHPTTTGGQAFGVLEVAGGAAQRPTRTGNGAISRPISAASQGALTADGSTMWFSALMSPTGTVPGSPGFAVNSYGTLIFGDAPLTGGSGFSAAPIQAGGNGLGVGFAGTGGGGDFGNMRVQGVAYDGGTVTQGSPTTVGNVTTLIVGRVEWSADGSDDVLDLYIVGDPTAPLGAPFATIATDLDQSGFDQISIGDSQTSIFDEIRFGPALADVLPVEAPPEPSGPNIIYILVDDMGYSDIGCYGGEIETPNIDSLAADGLSFRQYYNNAKCETTRTSILTGLYHGRGLNNSGGATLAEAVRTVGYRTYVVGKWHLGTGSRVPTSRGFDNFYGFYGGFSDYFPDGITTNSIKRDTLTPNNFVSAYSDSSFSVVNSNISNQTSFPNGYYITDAFGDNAVAFIQDAVTNHPSQPFFMYLSFNAPHTPLQAPVDLINKYRGRYAAGWDVMRQEKWGRQKALGLVDPGWQLSNLRDDIPPWDELSATQQEAEDHRRAVYAAMMDSVDQNVGKVLQQLSASGISDDTLVIFTSDNGAQAFDNTNNRASSPSQEDSRWSMGPAWAAFSNAPFRYYKQAQHQGGICTPFIARWPNTIAPGTMTDQPGHVVDMMATVVDIADVDYDSLTKDNGDPVPPMDGKSLLPIFEGGSRPAPDFWGFEYSSSEFAVIQGDWKLVAFSSSPWRLFNLKHDRTETNNLRWQYPDKAQELAGLYDQWAIDTYGNSSRTYAERDLRSQLSQELRYTQVLGGGRFSSPGGAKVDLNNIGNGAAAALDDHWEFYDTDTSASGVGNSSDSLTFASKSFCGDGSLIVQVESMRNLTSSGGGGIMFRESVDDDAAMLMLEITDGGDCIQHLRGASGETSSASTLATGLALPAFLKISREADQFTPSYSTDGSSWVDFAPVELNLGIETLAGLAASSGSNSTRGTVVFREWENLDLSAYPHRRRDSDGLSQYLVYALGVGANESAASALPEFGLAVDGGQRYPEFRFSRRIGIPPSQFVVRWSGQDLERWEDDSANWMTLDTTPNPDGISDSVLMRRSVEIGPERASFYSLEVTK